MPFTNHIVFYKNSLTGWLCFFQLAILLFGCGRTSDQTSGMAEAQSSVDTLDMPPLPQPKIEIIDSSRPLCFLFHASASSTAEDSDVGYLLDNNPATVWVTRPGAGPDEMYRIMLADDQEYYIEYLELRAPAEGQLFDIQKVEVFINGVSLKSSAPDDVFFIGKVVHTIDIRILEVGSELERSFQVGQENIIARQFPREFQVGLSDLKLFGKEGREYRIVPPRIVRGSISPSSNLNPLSAYHTGRLFDGQTDLAWMEGSEGSGEGDSILFELAEPINLSGMVIWNGFQASPEQFEHNTSLRRISFGPLREPGQEFSLQNKMGGQHLAMAGDNRAGEFVLRIKAAYPGTAYQDLAISEMVLLEGEQPIVIQSGLPQQFREELEIKAKGSILTKVLNRRIYNEIVTENTFRRQSLLLHSDGTFDYFLEEVSSAEIPPLIQIGHGAWQIITVGDQEGEINISGRLTTFQGQNGQKMVQKPLTDTCKLTPDKMEGERELGTFYLY